MLAIRLNRTGKRNRAHFRVVVQEHTKAPGKRHVEIVGSYDPHKKTIILKAERIKYWISQGAQVSDAVHNMLVREGVIEAKKIAKKMPRPVVKEVPVEAEVASVEEPKAEEALVTETAAPAVPVMETPVKAVVTPVVETTVAEVAPTEAGATPVAEESRAEEIVTDNVFASTTSKDAETSKV